MEYAPIIALGLVLLLVITRPFTVLLHELGHAIPALLFTRNKVIIYIGSYGNTHRCFALKTGRLTIWFRYNPLKWWWGLCEADGNGMTWLQQIIYVAGGALFSLIIATTVLYIAFTLNMHGVLKLLCVSAFASALFDLCFNFSSVIRTNKDGTIQYSDGYTLGQIIKIQYSSRDYKTGIQLYNNKAYNQSATLFEQLIAKGWTNDEIYRLAGTSYLFCKQYHKVIHLYQQLSAQCILNADDLYCLGLAHIYSGSGDAADTFLQQSLVLQPDNAYALNAIGYLLTTRHQYTEAIPLLDKAIQLAPSYSYAYNNRGHAKIETGMMEEGLADIQYSLELDKENAYAYRNIGIYYLLKQEHEKARTYLIKSQEMDKETPLVAELLQKTLITGYKNKWPGGYNLSEKE